MAGGSSPKDNHLKECDTMKKILIVGSLVFVLALTLGVAGYAYAQARNLPIFQSSSGPVMMNGQWNAGFGPRMGGRGMHGGAGPVVMGQQGFAGCGMMAGGEDCPLHNDMIAALAEGLGLTSEDLETRLENGETVWTIAEQKGLTLEQFRTLLTEARTTAVNQAVADGVITQEQADWMLDRMGQMGQGGFGRGMMGARGLNGGKGFGMMGGHGQGPLHEYMVAEFAVAFDLTVETLEARLDAGDTMWTIAQEQGFTQEQFRTLMADARTTAINQAVANGIITQEQADWMLERMSQMMESGFGPGFGPCHDNPE
jgi:hypothetical protein